jgi:hypothetical protein
MNEVKIRVRNAGGREDEAFLRGLPNACIVCGSLLNPYDVAFTPSRERMKSRFDLVIYLPLHCTDDRCGRLNICQYVFGREPGNKVFYDLSRHMLAGDLQPHAEIPEHVRSLSLRFNEVYSQALAADSFRLQELTGVGLRKALEILVKDYAISRQPEERVRIETQPLGQCIQEFFDHEYLRECARRATWLGNDETHYRRVWSNYDIEDMKHLIELTLNWLNYVLMSEKYISSMSREKGKSNSGEV